MGSFDVACGLSNLPIGYDDKAGFILLREPRKYGRSTINPTGETVQVHATDRFKPFLPPIFGTYDTYGSLEEITPSVTTNLLEKMFHRPIEIIVKCIGNNGRSIYSTHGSIAENYMIPEAYEITQSYSVSDEDKFLALGFEKIVNKVNSELPAYSLDDWFLVQHTSYEWIVMYAKGAKTTWVFESDFDDILTMFGQVTGKYPGFAEEDWSVIKELASLNGMFFIPEVLSQMTTVVNAHNDFGTIHRERRDASWVQYLKCFDPNYEPVLGEGEYFSNSPFVDEETGRRKHASSWSLNINNYLSRDTSINPVEQDELYVYADSDEFSLLWDIMEVATALNRPFAPSLYSSEGAAEEVFDALADLTKSILKKRKEEYGDDDEDDEDQLEVFDLYSR